MVLEVEKNSGEKPVFGSEGWGFESLRARQRTPALETQAVQTGGIPNEPRGELTSPYQFPICGGRMIYHFSAGHCSQFPAPFCTLGAGCSREFCAHESPKP